MLNWHVSKSDHELIVEIARRASVMAKSYGDEYLQRDAMMDLTATHANGCKLRLLELVDAPKFDFAHDVFGIRRHIDRNTGQMQDCFLPRYAALEDDHAALIAQDGWEDDGERGRR